MQKDLNYVCFMLTKLFLYSHPYIPIYRSPKLKDKRWCKIMTTSLLLQCFKELFPFRVNSRSSETGFSHIASGKESSTAAGSLRLFKFMLVFLQTFVFVSAYAIFFCSLTTLLVKENLFWIIFSPTFSCHNYKWPGSLCALGSAQCVSITIFLTKLKVIFLNFLGATCTVGISSEG